MTAKGCEMKWLMMVFLMACSSKVKTETKSLNLRLGNDGIATVSFNVIEIKKEKKSEYVINGVMDYEAPGALQLKLDPSKPMLVAINKKVVTLKPLKDKYRYKTAKISQGERLLHIQSNDYMIEKTTLKAIVDSNKSVVVKIPVSPHKNGGFDGVIREEHKNQMIDFLD